MVVFAVMNENYPSFKHIKIKNIKNIVLGKKKCSEKYLSCSENNFLLGKINLCSEIM